MAMRFSLSLVLLLFIFSFFLHPSIAHNDPIFQTMEEFSGYPPIQESLVSNSGEAQPNQIRIVEVGNLSLWISTRSIITFLSPCGDIESVEMQSKSEQSQIAFVTFNHSLGADCAVLLSGTQLLDLTVNITLAPSRELRHAAWFPHLATATVGVKSSLIQAKDVFSSILATSYVLSKAVVNDKVQQVDQNFQVTENVKSAIAKSAVLKNQGVSISASWVTFAFDSVAKAAAKVGQNANEKLAHAEEEQRRKTT